MSIVVINAANWPDFATLVRTQALDLYAREAGVEFWDIGLRSAAATGDVRLWGHWPKHLGSAPTRIAAELHDRYQHVAAEGQAMLTVIIVVDAVDDVLLPAGSGQAARPQRRVVDEVRIRFGIEQSREAAGSVRFVLALRDGAARETDQQRAFEAVGPGRDVDVPLFDVAVFLARRGNAELHAGIADFMALRVLVDLARDPDATRALLSPSQATRDGRVMVLRTPPARSPASDRLRRGLVALLRAAENESPDASGTYPIVDLTQKVIRSIETSDPARALADVREIETLGPGDVPLTADLEKVWGVGPAPDETDWDNLRDGDVAERDFARLKQNLDDFAAFRDRRLGEERAKLDEHVRKARPEHESRIQEGCIDRSFGLSEGFVVALDTQRERLVERVKRYTATATEARASRLQRLAAERREPVRAAVEDAHHAFRVALDHWLSRQIIMVALALMALILVVYGVVLLAPPAARGLQPLFLLALLIMVGLVGLWCIIKYWQKLEKARLDAKAALLQADQAERAYVRVASDLGLRHVVAGRFAGTLVPLVERMRRHARDYDNLNGALRDVRRNLEAGLDRKPGEAEPAVSPAILGSSVREQFRNLLWMATPGDRQTVEIALGGASGNRQFLSSLTLDGAVALDLPKGPPLRRSDAPAPPAEARTRFEGEPEGRA